MRPPVHRRAGGGKPETTSNLENNEFLHRCCRLRTADSQDSRIKLCHGRLSSCLEIGSARTISILSPSKDAPGDQDLVELGAKTVIAVSSPLPGAPASSQLAGNHAPCGEILRFALTQQPHIRFVRARAIGHSVENFHRLSRYQFVGLFRGENPWPPVGSESGRYPTATVWTCPGRAP